MKVELEKIEAFERGVPAGGVGDIYRLVGFYKSRQLASLDAETEPQGYGDDEVKKVEIYIDSKGELYKLEKVADGFLDEGRDDKKEVINSIKGKLTQEEREFLGI